MTASFYSPIFGGMPLHPTPVPQAGHLLLPQAGVWEARGSYGRLLLQEVPLKGLLLRYLVLQFSQPMELWSREPSKGVQSLIALKGRVDVGFSQAKLQQLGEGQFALLPASGQHTQTLVAPARECHLVQTYYSPEQYTDLLALFPAFGKDLQKADRQPRFFLSPPRPVRCSVMDAIRDIFRERYQPRLLPTYWELRLAQSLFTQLAQAYSEAAGRVSTPLEREKAAQAKTIIENDLARHYPNDELARLVDWSESSLKRAFRQEYGMGMYEYLRRLRMHKARELLLAGEQVKTVAPAVGMRPSSFTMEFQKFFGYKATSLRSVKP